MKIANVMALVPVIVLLTMLLIAVFLVVHNTYHILEGDAEASASFAHIGTVNGNQHVLGLFFGIVLLLVCAYFANKMYKGVRQEAPEKEEEPTDWDTVLKPTETGKQIARMMRERRRSKE